MSLAYALNIAFHDEDEELFECDVQEMNKILMTNQIQKTAPLCGAVLDPLGDSKVLFLRNRSTRHASALAPVRKIASLLVPTTTRVGA